MKTDKITVGKLKSILADKNMQSYTTNIKVSRPYGGGGPRKPKPPRNNKLDLILDRLTKIEENQKKDHELLQKDHKLLKKLQKNQTKDHKLLARVIKLNNLEC
ncbi:MAG: hypothetical protein MJ223_03600 [Mycoplasmoidaceae bacterium]|nr:hypothetical protein [Mycoplasmoidaceae bacterium]